VYYVQCGVDQSLTNGKAIGLWVAGDNAYGVCVIVANLVLFHRHSTFDIARLWEKLAKKQKFLPAESWVYGHGMKLYAFSVGSYFFFLGLESTSLVFPKVFGSFGHAWGQLILWISLLCICLQTSATEALWNLVVHREDIFDDHIKNEYIEEYQAH